jgi:hypothetical protein
MQNLPAAVFRIMRSSYSRDPSPTCTGADGVHGFAGEPNGGASTSGRRGGAVLGGAGADEGAAAVIIAGRA